MRYGVVSDIHGNLEALEAALGALSRESVDAYMCVGDVVGYGADPKACISRVKSLCPEVLIAGNHDWGVVGLLDLGYFNEMAREAVVWTRSVLEKSELDFLRSFQLVRERKDCMLVHGSLDSPEKFYYIAYPDDAYETVKLMKGAVCFVGHSHVAGLFCAEGKDIKFSKGKRVKIDRKNRYVVNVGSIGQPRDGDWRASFAIYDDGDETVEIRRVEYDIRKAQEKILKVGLPERLATRLAEGR